MHRSGTSAVAGALQQAGLYLGSVLRWHESNRRGTREHLGIVALHDAILAHSGGSWRVPPERVVWTDEHCDRRDRIVASFSAAELWGFKDPRTVLLLDFWRDALGDALLPVGVFREPTAVVASLLRRDGGESGEWFALWERYNEELLRQHEAAPFPLLEFGADAVAFREQLVPVLRQLRLRGRGHEFFDAKLTAAERPEDMPDATPNAVASAERLLARLRAAQRGG